VSYSWSSSGSLGITIKLQDKRKFSGTNHVVGLHYTTKILTKPVYIFKGMLL